MRFNIVHFELDGVSWMLSQLLEMDTEAIRVIQNVSNASIIMQHQFNTNTSS
jgi:hypothetical protein